MRKIMIALCILASFPIIANACDDLCEVLKESQVELPITAALGWDYLMPMEHNQPQSGKNRVALDFSFPIKAAAFSTGTGWNGFTM